MSLEHNKTIVRRYQDAYNTGNFAALAEVVAADVLTPNIVSGLPSQRARLKEKIQAARPLPDALKQKALEALVRLPDGDALCHGDFHPDNIVLSQHGPVVLDWVDASSGHPLADVARTALLMQHAALPPHMPGRRLIQAGRRLWYALYLRHYSRLRSLLPREVEAWMLPIAAARLSEGIAEEKGQLLALVWKSL